MIADTGATGHFFDNSAPLHNKKEVQTGIKVLIPDGSTMVSTHIGSLGLADLPPEASTAHVFKTLASGSLISIGQLADAGCEAHFDKKKVLITKDSRIIMTGTRSKDTGGLWEMEMQKKSTHSEHKINVIMKLPGVADRVNFYIACMFSPAISTLCKAIDNNNLSSFPGNLTSQQVRKYGDRSKAILKGHQDQLRAGTNSTKIKPLPNCVDIEQDYNPAQNDQITEFMFCGMYIPDGRAFTDQTGRFLIPSISGDQYLLIFYHYDSNFIHAEPMQNRTKEQHVAAYKRTLHIF